MAGLFALLYGLFWVGSNLSEGVQNDIYTNNNKKYAESSGKEIYRDANGNWHWTENNEVVNVVGKPGSTQGYKIVGVKSHTIYHNELSDQEILDKRFQDGIEYCKENGIKYLPWNFRNDLLDGLAYTGIEIETGKKYAVIKKGCHWEPADGVYKAHMEDDHCIVYLEDKPHWASRGYGEYLTYDAVHDGTQEMYEQDFTSVTHEKHYYSFSKNYMKIPSEQDYEYWYYSVCHPITKEEYKARTTYIKGFEPRVERAVPARGY